MVKESQTTGNSSGEKKRFIFVDRWKQRIEKSIFLPVEESGQKRQRAYPFIFSLSGWELWQRKKELLIEGLQKALPKVEEAGIPVRAICVLQELDVPEGERKPQREDFYLIVALEMELEDSHLEIAREMSRTLQDWRDRELIRQDMELAKQLTVGWLRCE